MTYALIVDDEADLLDDLTRTVERAGLSVVTAQTWDDAVAKFLAYSPLVVVADFNLQDSRDGLQLLAELASQDPATNLILCSAYVNAEEAAQIEAEVDWVDRVLRKTPKLATQIVEIVTDASARANDATDWRSFAEARKSRSGDPSQADKFAQLLPGLSAPPSGSDS